MYRDLEMLIVESQIPEQYNTGIEDSSIEFITKSNLVRLLSQSLDNQGFIKYETFNDINGLRYMRAKILAEKWREI